MEKIHSLVRRFRRFFSMLPRRCANGFKFRVFYLRESKFTTPSTIHVTGKAVSLQSPSEAGVSADFLHCIIFNSYGLKQNLRDVRTILDVGANLGFFSLAARQNYPQATIHAYEPNPRILPLLQSNTADLKIQIYPEALGGTNGYVTVVDAGASNVAYTRPSESSGGAIRQIPLETAIERLGGSVDLLKLDCEGAEWELLKSNSVWKSIRDIRMEYHLSDGQSVEGAISALADLNFQVIRLIQVEKHNGIIWAQRG